MKKTLSLLLAMMMVLALCACGAKEEAPAEVAPEVAEAVVEAAPAEAAPAGAAVEAGDASGEASGEAGEASGAMTGMAVDLSVNEVIPTEAAPETYTADAEGWQQYMLDCAYYAMGTGDSDNKLGSTYYDILNGGMTDMFVNMWGVDAQDAFIANGGVPTVNPWSLVQGAGTPETVPDDTAE